MSKGYFFWRLLAALFLIAVLAVGGVLIFQAGQSVGYSTGVQVGAAAGQGDSPGAAPLAPIPYRGAPLYHPGMGITPFGFFFPFFGFVCLAGFAFLFFGLLGALFRPWRWRHAAWGAGDYPHPHPHGVPPWERQPTHPGAPSGEPSGEQPPTSEA